MSRKKRIPRTTIFIACEGKNTEPIYFERIKEEVEDCNLLSVEVYPDRNEENPKTDALGLIREAKSRLEYFDEVWVVFDKNGYSKHKEAFDEAKEEINGKRVKIAFSSISFEHWVLLHFEKNNSAFSKSADIIDAKFATNETYFDDYSKRAEVDIYPKLKNQTERAVENASWLRFSQREEIAKKPIYEINPYTDVDVLVKRLLDISKTVKWAKLAETIDLKDADVTVNLSETNLQVVILNKRNVSFISTQCAFSTIDSENNIVSFDIEKSPIEPQNEGNFQLCEKTEKLVLVKIEFENTVCFVEI